MTPEASLRHRLAADGGWVYATDLRQGLPHLETVLDDTLSDMVIRGDILFNARTAQYRLALGPAARKAVQRLARDDTQQRALVGATARDGTYLMGLARRSGSALLCAELAFDTHPGAAALAALAPRIGAWLDEKEPTA